MKYRVFILSLLAFATLNANGQSPSSLLTDGRGWHYRVDVNMGDETATTFTDAFIHGDTIIEGRTCKRLYVESGHDSDYGTQSAWFDTLGRGGKYHSAWYEEGRKVYRIMDGSTEPELVFDFGLHAGDRLPGSDNLFYWYDDHIIVDGSMADDGTRTTSRIYRRMRFAEGEPKESPRLSDWCLIEGVGGNEGILYPESQSAAVQDGFISERFTHCDQFLENKGGIPVYENLIAREDFMTSNTYRPLVEEGKMWTVVDVEDSKDAERYFDFTVYRYLLRGDSVVDGHTWKRLVAVDDDGNETFLHLLREQERKVYVFDQKEKKECMIFDFGLHENDSVSLYVGVGYSGRFLDYLEEGNRISSEGLRQYGSRSHRCWEIEKSFTVTEFGEEVTITPLGRWIEGVGSEFDFLSTNYQLYYPSCICYKITVECSVNGEVIYSNVPKEIASEWEKVSVALVWNNATQDTSNNLFDLQGRELTAEPQRGVFIKGGKKVAK